MVSVVWPQRKEKKAGEAGYRSLCLTHAKRALYHLSYIPWSGVFGSCRRRVCSSPPTVRSDSLVVMTSALHAEGREFNPRSEYFFFQTCVSVAKTTKTL